QIERRKRRDHLPRAAAAPLEERATVRDQRRELVELELPGNPAVRVLDRAPHRAPSVAADPDRRSRRAVRTRVEDDVAEREPASVRLGGLAAPQRLQDLDRLVGERAPRREVDAERAELGLEMSRSDADHEASAR